MKLDYYSVIGGLGSLDRSHSVVLGPQELRELVKNTEENRSDTALPDLYRNNKERVNIHGYLGGRVDMKEVSEMTYDLNHTLLGGYVPRQQLETLCSTDFARYMHRKVDCGDAMQVYDTFLADNHLGLAQRPRIHTQTTQSPQAQAQAQAQGQGQGIAQPMQDKIPPVQHDTHVRKVVVCKRCRARFLGPSRMKSLRRHNCKAAI